MAKEFASPTSLPLPLQLVPQYGTTAGLMPASADVQGVGFVVGGPPLRAQDSRPVASRASGLRGPPPVSQRAATAQPGQASQDAPPSGLGSLAALLALAGTALGARAQVARGSDRRMSGHRAQRRLRAHRRPRTQRQFFGSVEQLNPFYEKPEEATRKKYQPTVDKINSLEEALKAKSDDELRAATEELRRRARDGEDLEALLPEAFAVVREASDRVLGLRHFDVQLMGGVALHEGNIAEMGTGEGKTLVAILPAFLNSLGGKGVHVVTVNDYLARRDAEWVGQPLRFLGCSVGIVQSGMDPEQKRTAYRCDVSYVTNSELGFDYLRDQMAPTPSDLSLREEDPFNFAVVDEVDSILIDEARTPLIISGTASNPSGKYEVAREVAKTLKKTVQYTVDEKQRQCVLIEDGVQAAEKLLGKDDLFDPQDPWFPFLVNALNAKEIYVRDKQYIVKRGEVVIVDEFTGRVMDGRRWSNGLHQAVEAKEGVQIQAESVTLASISYQSLFRLFNKLSGMTGTAFTEAKEFEEIYKLKCVVIPPNRERRRNDIDDQVYVDDIGKWKAVAREVENSHRLGRPVLIGTTNVENSEVLAELLEALDVPYQLLNAKPENVARETEIVAASGRKYAVTIATNMAGRGTDILLGGNSTMMARLKLRELLFSGLFPKKKDAWMMPEEFYPVDLSDSTQKQVAAAVQDTLAAWQVTKVEKPNTTDAAERIVKSALTELEAEERLSLACEKSPTDDQALLRLREAYQVMAAEFKEITDLEKNEVIALGGLYVLGTERHESRRIDNQLRGRCARQGDPGATRFFLSLNDSIFRIFGGEQIKKMMGMMSFTASDDTPLESGLLSSSLEEAQKKVENYYYSVRKSVFDYDDVMDTQRKIVYSLRRRALLDTDESIAQTLVEFSDKNMEDFVGGHIEADKPKDKWLLSNLSENIGIYSADMKELVTEEALQEVAQPGGAEGRAAVTVFLKAQAREAMGQKLRKIEDTGAGLTGIVTRQILLMQLDQFWQQHLKNMDFMRTGVVLRAYGQKNPLTEYKLEGYQVFLKMMSRVRRNAVYNFLLFQPRKLTPMSSERVQALIPSREVRRRQMQEAAKEQALITQQNEAMAAAQGAASPESSSMGPTSKTINLARLALNVRSLLEARASLKELGLASFMELKDAFARAGLVTLGDQLRWAKACAEFKLFEDEITQEVYIGLQKDASGSIAGDLGSLSAEDVQQTQAMFQKALDDPDFMNTIDQFSQRPEAFLALMKENASQEGWGPEDVAKMRDMYRAAGIDLDTLLQQMNEARDSLPPQQREVVDFMQSMLQKDKEIPKEGEGEEALQGQTEKVAS